MDEKEKIFEISTFRVELEALCEKHGIHGGVFTWVEAPMHDEKMKVGNGAMMCVGDSVVGCTPCAMLALGSSLKNMDNSCKRALTGAMQLLSMDKVQTVKINPNSSETVN